MAVMTFREPNQVKWRGIKPAHNGTQLILSGGIVNGTSTLYTVPAGVVCYLTDWTLSTSGMSGNVGLLCVTNSLDVIQYSIAIVVSALNAALSPVLASYFYPVEIPSGYKIKITSDGAGFIVYGFIHGWVE